MSGTAVAALLASSLAMGTGSVARAVTASAASSTAAPVDARMLDELTKDVQHFSEMVAEYRGTARMVLKRAYADKIKEINAKYDAQINLNEKEARDRRRDAIAVFEAFLQRYPNDKRWTPDAMFRLAELYYERSAEDFLDADEMYKKAIESANPPTTPPPKVDYTPTISLYKRLLTEFPSYRFLDATYYLLGFCLGEMGQEAEAKQALLALVCENQFKPLDPPANQTKGDEQSYKDCTPVRKGSKFIPESWTRIGEFHFDNPNELKLAIAAFRKVLDFKDSPYYDRALYKLAWSYYRDNRFPEAVREFDNLVKYADAKKAAGQKVGSDLRPEAIQYLGVSFSEPDWDGDSLPDPINGLQRAQEFYKGREDEPHVREVFQRLGDIYFDSTKYSDAVAVYKVILQKWPYYTDAPKVQDKIIRSYERDRNLLQAAKEREALGRNYTKGSDWYQKNRENPEALAAAQQLAEDALLTAATNVHAGAQACKTKALETPKDTKKMDECKLLYRTAAELYEKYLAAYPNSKRSYEFSAFYADALFYSGQMPQAIVAYQAVRDSQLDNRYQEDASFRMIKAYEEIIDEMKRDKKIEDPPIPDEKNTKPPVSPLPMPEIYTKYVEAIDWYVTYIKNDRVSDLKYAAAVINLRYHNWPEARKRLGEITELYCGSKPEVGFKAYDAILQTYFIDFNVQDEEQKDCALGKLLSVADQFSGSPCGKSPMAAPYLERIAQIKASVKTTIITKRLQLSMENEEKGTNKELTVCRESTGGIATVTGISTAPTKPGEAPKPSKISTELDVGLALDLIDVVNANPKDPGAPTALNNACVIYEKLFQFGEATKCYERLYSSYPDSEWGKEALWNSSRNHYRFFEFDQAVKGYLTVAQDPTFAGSEHRKEALGLAASLLDNDQQYLRAADLYKKYSEAISDKPQDSAQAYFFACNAYEKAHDNVKQSACLKDFIKKYSAQPPAGEFVVQAYMKQAVITEQSSRDKNATLAAYKRVRDEFISRKLPAATPAAGFAAKADFLILEEKFKAFQKKELKFGSKPEQIKKTFDSFTAESKALNDEYQKIWNYKDATWTLAAFLRSGDIYYEFAQKLIKAANNPPDDVKKLAKMACKANPDDCGMVEGQYKDAVYQFVTPVEDEAKKRWKDTLARASQLGVTNEYVKKARENLSKYLPDEFPFIKDEKIGLEYP
ncbi:MAG TPA: tetratricopeptide repeat protein [Polyangia bacterium]|jgi:tetratricopeptide (TPR) repeat protein|nr:tetratricopeptide repeat protein [Polyangia bacterium]